MSSSFTDISSISWRNVDDLEKEFRVLWRILSGSILKAFGFLFHVQSGAGFCLVLVVVAVQRDISHSSCFANKKQRKLVSYYLLRPSSDGIERT